jgi:hypothetical protein
MSTSRRFVFGFYFLRVQSLIRLTLRVLGLAKALLLKTFVDCSYEKRFCLIKRFVFIGVLHLGPLGVAKTTP